LTVSLDLGVSGLSLAFALPFALDSSGLAATGSAQGFAVGAAFKFVEQLLCRGETLVSRFPVVAGELGFFFVLAKVELHVNVGHGFSL